MALQAAPVTTPTQDYNTALGRWLARQNQSRQTFNQAAQPLQQNIQAFQPGGSFGAGQIATLEDEARRAGALATSQQVASGMSSGSLATSTGLRISSDLTKAKLGVEDTRMQFLARARESLAGLRGQEASQVGATSDPFFSTFQSSKATARGQDISAFNTAQNRALQRTQLAEARKVADKQYQLQVKQFEVAQKELDLKRKNKAAGSASTGFKSLQF